ncbi:MAG: DUF4136 domain-containing protein [Thiotrichales bacterium]|nr:DUF4136 domain-containing protein [Thiotrichales bacterium]
MNPFTRPIQWLFIASTLLFLSACSTPISKDYNPQVDFKRYQSLGFLPPESRTNPEIEQFQIQQPLVAQRVKQAISRHFLNRGIGIDREPINGYISAHLQTETYLAQDPFSVQFGFGSYGRHGGILFGTREPLIEEKRYLLVIDIYNPNQEVVWRGKAPFDPELQQSPQASEQQVQEVVERILSEFPPKP